MKLNKIAFILIFTLAFGGAAFYFSGQQMEKVEDQEAGTIFLPGLMGKINRVAKVVLTDKETTTNLVLKDDEWVVEEKSNYPAEFSKIKKLLLNLAEMETIESKTSKPENYGRLGVQSVGEPGDAASRQVQLLDKAGNMMYELIVGKSKPSRVPGAKSSIYVRQKNETKSWLVSGELASVKVQTDWLDKRIIDINSARIQSVEIRQPDNSQLLISKQDKADENYSVQNLPLKAELTSDSVANPIAGVLQNLSFDDVIARDAFKVDDTEITHVTFKSFDGLVLNAKLSKKEEKNYVWFDAKPESDNETAVKESKALNAKFVLWVYEIPAFKADTFQKKLEDVIKTADAGTISEGK